MHYAYGASMSSRTSPSPYYIRPDGRPWKVLYHKNLLTMFVCLRTLHPVSWLDRTEKQSVSYFRNRLVSVGDCDTPLEVCPPWSGRRACHPMILWHRLKDSQEDIATIVDHLNWRKCSRFGQLGGIVSLPVPATKSTFTNLHCNVSNGVSNTVRTSPCLHDVTSDEARTDS